MYKFGMSAPWNPWRGLPHLEVKEPEKVLDTNTNGYFSGTSCSIPSSKVDPKQELHSGAYCQPVKPITDSEEFIAITQKQDELKDLIQASKDIAEEMKTLSETIQDDIEELVDDSIQKFVDATEIPVGTLLTNGDKWKVWTEKGLKSFELRPEIMVTSPESWKVYTEKQLKKAYANYIGRPKSIQGAKATHIIVDDLYDQKKPETSEKQKAMLSDCYKSVWSVDSIYEELKEDPSYSSEKFKIEVQEEAIETAKESIKHAEQRIAELKKKIVHNHLNPERKETTHQEVKENINQLLENFDKQIKALCIGSGLEAKLGANIGSYAMAKHHIERIKDSMDKYLAHRVEFSPIKITVPKGVSLSVKSEPKREIIVEEKNENQWIALSDTAPKIGAKVEILNIKKPKEIPDIGVYQGEDALMHEGFHKIKLESDMELPYLGKFIMVLPDQVSWRPLAGQRIASCLPEEKIFKAGDYFLGENQNKELVVGRVFSVAYNEHTNKKEPIPIAIIHTQKNEVNWIHGTKAVKITESDLPAIQEILLS